jgi:hypothetical protein
MGDDFDFQSLLDMWDSGGFETGGFDPGGESLSTVADAGIESGSGGGINQTYFGEGSGGGNAGIDSSGTDWAKIMGKGGAGNAGVGALMMMLNAMRQRKDAKAGEADEQAAVQQGTNAMARSLSTQGNPAGSGRAQQELTNYASTALARFRAARRDKLSQANNNLYGAGGASLQALLAALSQGGAFN